MNNKSNKNNEKKVFTTLETIILVIVSLVIGISVGLLFNNKSTTSNNLSTNDKYLDEFIKSYNYVIENYYKDIDKEDLINNAISGMMGSLDDPYSVYLDEKESSNFNITLNGSYEGIGVQISKEEKSGYMLILSVFKNSPAEESGLIAGDYVISIDGKDSKDMTASDFSSYIKNSNNESYNFKILRNGEELEIVLKKNTVILTSVTSEYYEKENKKIGYIYIGIFANNTYKQFKEELEKLESKGIQYLIIDVRSNTGGHLTAVDSILDLFLNENQIKYQFEQNSKITKIYGTGNESKEYKIVLLGNEASASASEVLIAGLKENFDCVLIGNKTFGKGTVQELITLSDGSQYKITVKKWLTPNGNWINDTNGINPDIEIDLDKKYYSTYNTEDDSQLQRAIKYIINKE